MRLDEITAVPPSPWIRTRAERVKWEWNSTRVGAQQNKPSHIIIICLWLLFTALVVWQRTPTKKKQHLIIGHLNGSRSHNGCRAEKEMKSRFGNNSSLLNEATTSAIICVIMQGKQLRDVYCQFSDRQPILTHFLRFAIVRRLLICTESP